jgi:exocyst complex component 7
LFQKTLQSACDQISSQDKLEAKLSFGEQLGQLKLLAQVLSESLEQIGPVTGFLRIYENIKSQFLTACLAQANAAAKDQEVKMGYSRDIYQRGSSLLIPYGQYMILLLQAEHQAGSEVIPKHHGVTNFVNTITAPIDGFLEVCDALLSRVRRSIQRREMNDLYLLIDVWDGLSNMFIPQSILLAHCGKKGHDIQLFMANAATTVLCYFKDFYEEFKSEQDTKKQPTLSMDGTVHENTSTTMNAVKKICEYSESIQFMIESSQSTNLGFPSNTVKEYTNKILDSLLIDIEVKAKNYKKPVLSYLFVLNNVNYIFKSIKGTVLNDIVDAQTIDNIDKIIKKQLDHYRSTYCTLT